MQIQKHLSKKVGDKTYYKYVLVLPSKIFKDSDIKEGEKLEAEIKKGEIRIKKQTESKIRQHDVSK